MRLRKLLDRFAFVRIFAILVPFLYLSSSAWTKEKIPLTKSIHGRVTDANKNSLAGAKVFVQNLKQKTTTILVTDQDGLYSVAGLDPKVDYEVHAEYGNLQSETKAISSFLNRFDNLFNFELGGQNAVGSQRSSDDSSKKSIGLQTVDGVKIAADWYHPSLKANQKFPAVLLLHGFGESRRVWESFIADHLLKNNWMVLNVDLRGHGQSLWKAGQKLVPNSTWLTDANQFPLDLDAAVNWLRSQEEVDPNRIGVIGVDMGANLAYLASGKFEAVRSAVVLSGNPEQARALAGALENFQPHSILYVATQGDGESGQCARQFEKLTGSPVKVQVFEGSSAHGSSILKEVPEATTLIVDWLKNLL
jgi:pimeloyl-ACP methyl ester carboxylesterase